MRLRFFIVATLGVLGSIGVSSSAQEAVPAGDSNPLCRFHGPDCAAPPAEWQWQRLTPSIGTYSVELPCNAQQADAFGQILAISRARFPAGATRSCMKAAAGFTSTMVGLTALPDGDVPPEIERLLDGAPDLFTTFLRNVRASGAVETGFMGRRAVMNTIERDDRRTRVMLVEAGQYAVIMLNADISSNFPGTREEADAAVERFFQSLEIAS